MSATQEKIKETGASDQKKNMIKSLLSSFVIRMGLTGLVKEKLVKEVTGLVKKRLDKNGERKKGKSLILPFFSSVNLSLGSQPRKNIAPTASAYGLRLLELVMAAVDRELYKLTNHIK